MRGVKLNVQALIWGLEELADAECQERVWAGKVRGEMSSFEEAITTTFNSSHLGNILYMGRGADQLTPQMLALAGRLHLAVQKVPQLGLSPEEVLRHPAMVDIRSLAGAMLTLIERGELRTPP